MGGEVLVPVDQQSFDGLLAEHSTELQVQIPRACSRGRETCVITAAFHRRLEQPGFAWREKQFPSKSVLTALFDGI
jgi:hypothetical protein